MIYFYHFNNSKYCQQLIVMVLGKLPYVQQLDDLELNRSCH
jgi:hypothetical protein